MLSAISRRNAVLHCAACSNVRGGTKRVLVRPAIDALAITAIPQVGTAALSISATAVRMTPPMPRDPRRYPRLVRRGRKKQFMPPGPSADLGGGGERHSPSPTPEREVVALVPLLTPCGAMARARGVAPPPKFTRAR